MKKIVLGIDIGGTNTVFGLIDNEGHCLAKSSLPTTDFDTPEGLIEVISKYVKDILPSLGNVSLQGIGIGAPNGNFYRSSIEFAPNLSWTGIILFKPLFKKHFDVPVFVTNDANAAAIGEMTYGVAKGVKDFIIVTLGTGLGSGVVSNGELVYGHDGFAGELGHYIIEENGRLCSCGRKGCLENYVSASGVVKTAKILLSQSDKSSLLRAFSGDMTAKKIAEAAIQGDEIAVETYDFTTRKLGFALANAITITSPELIVLYGGLANSAELLVDSTKKYMEEYLLNIFQNKVSILPSSLKGGNAAILGAGALAFFNQ